MAKKCTIKTYINPSINSAKIYTVSVLPLRNAFVQKETDLGTGDMIEINKIFHTAFASKNPNTKIVDAITSVELLNKSRLVSSYDTLLRLYENTGMPNTQILAELGKSLHSDAIVQGFVREIFQRDGVYGGNRGETRITIKYVMFSVSNGDIIWEATCVGYKGTSTTLKPAPPVSDVIEIIKKKIVSAMPVLSTL